MGRMHGTGISASALPYSRRVFKHNIFKPSQVVDLIVKFAKKNLTASQIKTIITRCGEGTKIVCSGNLAQIDSNYLSPVTSGLTYIVERFKDFDGSANIFLNGVVRSRLASFAEENL